MNSSRGPGGALHAAGSIAKLSDNLGPMSSKSAAFNWSDPFQLDRQLTDDERMIRDTARSYAKDKLLPRVLEMLGKAGVAATFFVVGRKVQAHPELVRELVRAGHQVELHGFDHDRLFSLRSSARVADDIRRTQDAVEAAGAPRPSLLRPPIGFVSHFTVAGARKANVTLVGCSVRALDGFGKAAPGKVTERLLRALTPGALLAMHDAAEHDDHEPASLSALPRVLEALHERSLRPVTLSSWLTDEALRA